MIRPTIYVLMIATILCSCGSEGPREIYPTGSRSAGVPDVQQEPIKATLQNALGGIAGIKAVNFGPGKISLSLSDGQVIELGEFERWDFDTSNKLAMLYAEAQTNLTALTSLSLQQVPPSTDLLKAMHLDESRSKEAALYQSSNAKQSGTGLYFLFLGAGKGKADNEPTVIFIIPTQKQ